MSIVIQQINWPELHRLNRVWRAWMDVHSNFVTPKTITLLRCARIEANEAADIEIRTDEPAMARNNERQHTITGELAQVGMLTLTAMLEFDQEIEDCTIGATMDDICDCANQTVMDYSPDDALNVWQWNAQQLLYMIAKYPDVNVPADLRQCWLQLAQKHASYHMDKYPEELKL